MIDMWTFMPCNGEHVVMQWSEESFINIEGNQARLLPQIDRSESWSKRCFQSKAKCSNDRMGTIQK